jgi:hypothetical protein
MTTSQEIRNAADRVRDILEDEGLIEHLIGATCYAVVGAYLALVGVGAYGIATYVLQFFGYGLGL